MLLDYLIVIQIKVLLQKVQMLMLLYGTQMLIELFQLKLIIIIWILMLLKDKELQLKLIILFLEVELYGVMVYLTLKKVGVNLLKEVLLVIHMRELIN